MKVLEVTDLGKGRGTGEVPVHALNHAEAAVRVFRMTDGTF